MNVLLWIFLCGVSGWLSLLSVVSQTLQSPHLYIISVGVMGCVLALVQGGILPFPGERWAWIFYGFIGAAGGTVVLWGADWYVDDVVGGAGFGLVVGIMGWAIIRDHIRAAWRWIMFNVFGYMLVGVSVLLTKTLYRLYASYEQAFPPIIMASILGIGALGYALVSGVGLAHLLKNQDNKHSQNNTNKKGTMN